MTSFDDHAAKIVCVVLFSGTTIIMFVSTLYCSITDPSDDYMIQNKNGNKFSQDSLEISNLLFCESCHSHVNINSRHCRQCSRCVSKFDHHCIWINNCIG